MTSHTRNDLTPTEQAGAAELVTQWMPWIESEARKQAKREARGLSFTAVGDLLAEPEPPSFFTRRIENAYRRGYWHGFGKALANLIQSGAKRSAAWSRVARFCDGPLKRWRYADKPRDSEVPPSFDPRAMSTEESDHD